MKHITFSRTKNIYIDIDTLKYIEAELTKESFEEMLKVAKFISMDKKSYDHLLNIKNQNLNKSKA